jgi:hypothetical protein
MATNSAGNTPVSNGRINVLNNFFLHLYVSLDCRSKKLDVRIINKYLFKSIRKRGNREKKDSIPDNDKKGT